MDTTTFIGLINNAALLLALALLYDTIALKRWAEKAAVQVLIGIILGAIGIAVMMTPWEFTPGVIFDTRSVLLSVGGLFFGSVPILMVVLMTGVYRLYQGGAGAWTGVAVIITSAAIGVGWRHLRRNALEGISWLELYIFGIVVQLAMLLWMLSLPWSLAIGVLSKISLPVMTVYPVGTVLLGKFMTTRLTRKQAEEEIKHRNRELGALYAISTVVSQSLDLGETLNAGLDKVLELMHLDVGGVYFADPLHLKLDLVVHRGVSERFAHDLEFLSVDEKTLDIVRARGKLRKLIFLVQAVTKHPLELKRIASAMEREGLTLARTVPVLLQAREEIVGLMILASREPRQYSEAELDLLTSIGQQMAIAIENARLYEASQQELIERKRAEREAQERRMYLEGVLTAAPDAIVTLDAQHRVVEWNPGAERLFGYSAGETIGQNLDNLVTAPGVFEEAVGFTHVALSGKRVSPVETVRYRQDGSPVQVIVAGSPILVGDELIGLVAVYTDITERKRAEDALRELNATLEARVAARTAEIRAEKEKSEAILHSAGDAIVMADRDRRIRYVNPAFTALTGYTAKEVLGQQASLVGAIVPKWVRESMESVLTEGESWQGEAVGQRKGGRTYDAVLTITPMRDAGGEIAGYVSSHRDISQAKELERARSEFMSNVSHELRTPVTNLKLYTQLLRKGLRPEKREQFLRVMEEQTDRLAHMIQDILVMAELDSSQAVVDWESVSIATVIRHTVARYQSQAQEAGLTLTVEPVPPELPAVEGDPQRLTQALAKLVENAITFMPPGGRVTLEAGTAEEEGQRWVTVAVRDTGPGIASEEQEHIFERLHRGSLADSGHIPGTGLGLSIAQEIARTHGGRLTVESELGQGSAFTLWLRGRANRHFAPQRGRK